MKTSGDTTSDASAAAMSRVFSANSRSTKYRLNCEMIDDERERGETAEHVDEVRSRESIPADERSASSKSLDERRRHREAEQREPCEAREARRS